MENILDLSTNTILVLILLFAVMMVYSMLKEMIYKAAYVGTQLSFFGKVGLLILLVVSFFGVLSGYLAVVSQSGIETTLFYTLRVNAFLLPWTIYVYAAGIVFLPLLFLVAYLSTTALKRKNKKKIHAIFVIKQQIEAFYEELDHAVFAYLARKNGIQKSAGNFKDYRYFSNMKEDLSCKECLITLYYSLLLNRKYIDKLEEKIEDILNILGRNMPDNDKELASLFQKTIVVSEQIKKKLQDIGSFFKANPKIEAVGDDLMPHFYIEGNPDKSMEILRMFEELSIVILDNKHLSDALLDMLSQKINKLESLR